ncbi:hypothetical protein KM043_014692 [Ampulex compressa]|nr:hypothetical protein KM043_014692 [Ampulex compressa]
MEQNLRNDFDEDFDLGAPRSRFREEELNEEDKKAGGGAGSTLEEQSGGEARIKTGLYGTLAVWPSAREPQGEGGDPRKGRKAVKGKGGDERWKVNGERRRMWMEILIDGRGEAEEEICRRDIAERKRESGEIGRGKRKKRIMGIQRGGTRTPCGIINGR